MDLALELTVATLMVSVTIIIHFAGLAGLIALMRLHYSVLSLGRLRLDQVVTMLGVGFGLFALHSVEIWVYALLYWCIAGWPTFEQALYFSTTSYATIGYGDITLPAGWRLVGAIEGANGVILLGWSTAFFVSVVNRLRALEHDWLGHPKDGGG